MAPDSAGARKNHASSEREFLQWILIDLCGIKTRTKARTLSQHVTSMEEDDLFPVEVVISWRWRCRSNDEVIAGSSLQIFGYRGLTIADWNSPKIDVKNLRCPCGGPVWALAPIDKG